MELECLSAVQRGLRFSSFSVCDKQNEEQGGESASMYSLASTHTSFTHYFFTVLLLPTVILLPAALLFT